jgi:hypothetical protein
VRLGHDGPVTTSARPVAWLALGIAALAVPLVGLAPASAAGCRVVTVENDPPVGIGLSPPKSSVPYGGCVQFTDNAFGPPVTVTVAGGYHVDLDYGESTSGKSSYSATAPGTHAVTADNGTASAHGSITVGAPPSSSPSPSRSPSTSPRPAPAPSSSSSPSSGPRVAPTPRGHRHRAGPPVVLPSAAPPPTLPGVTATPGVVPSVAGSPPGPLQSTTPVPVAASGPVEPPSDRRIGLPAAVAALVVVGVGTALLRAVLAEPAVDSGRSVGGTA